MPILKCGYCPEIWDGYDRLAIHVHKQHAAEPVFERIESVNVARIVEDVAVTSPMLADTPDVPCICGLPLVPLDDDRDYPMWMHQVPAPKCRDAIPAAGMPTKKDRADLAQRWAETGQRLEQAGREMAGMRAALDAVDERLAKLDAQLTSPATVRRATLNQVWDRLVDEGHMGAAAVVMKMIQRVVDDQ